MFFDIGYVLHPFYRELQHIFGRIHSVVSYLVGFFEIFEDGRFYFRISTSQTDDSYLFALGKNILRGEVYE